MSETPAEKPLLQKRRRRMFGRSAAECIEPLTKPIFREHGFAETRIIRDWAVIVGKELAPVATPLSMQFPRGKTEGGTLTIAAPSAQSTVLQHLEPLILERIATYFGYRAIVRLRIEHCSPPKQETRKIATRKIAQQKPPPAAPLTTTIEDEELRTALQRLQQALQTEPA